MSEFVVKDSGARETFASGMVRDTAVGKVLWHLVASGPMLKRWAQHLTAGAQKYTADNWMKASGPAEYARFRESAFRHFMQWYYGDRDEDHAAAVFFNINGAEYVQGRIDEAFEAEETETPRRRMMWSAPDGFRLESETRPHEWLPSCDKWGCVPA